jgi:phosphatidylglycerophosphate synthase
VWLHVIIDGLDGPLARYQNSASPRGSFTDSFCDQIIVSTVAIGLMMKQPGVSIAAGSTFLVVYTAVLAISMVRNTLRIPYSWLLRPRLIVYSVIPLQLFVEVNLLEPLMWLCNAVMAFKLGTGFLKLRRRLSGPDDQTNGHTK